jgi:asparagine synthase (glutamine-hydrolysing)
MCGIAGILSNRDLRQHIHPMIKAMNRRGPDDSGSWHSGDCALSLGHTRLSIIDLSKDGHQPMSSQSKRYTIVFNGEIYNYKDLKNELEKSGTLFNSNSDTEVILSAWEKWGIESISKLRGMFAFAIWDNDEEILTIVRDRMGIKPLLWSKAQGHFIFASNIKAMLSSGQIDGVLNKAAFYDLMSLGAVFQPRTILKNVFALMPGTYMVVDKKSNIVEHKNYWELTPSESLSNDISKFDYADQVKKTRELLEEACKYHLISDVPVGSFLSGGVDSTILTALMHQISPYPVKSFSIGFENGPDLVNELSDAKSAADHIGCDHMEFILSGKKVADHFDDFIDSMDQPTYDGLNTYWVSKISKEYVTVAFSGLGGDELFAGYSHFGWPNRFQKSYGNMTRIGRMVYDYVPYLRPYTLGFKLQDNTPIGRMSLLRRIFSDLEIRNNSASYFCDEENDKWVEHYIENLKVRNTNDLLELTKYECKNYLLNVLLRDADSLSMGNSLEVRPVFLDDKIVEWALALPAESKWRNGVPKAILKDACMDLLPKDFFNRPKTGFTLPINRWLSLDMKNKFQEVLKRKDSEAFFDRNFLDNLANNIHNPRKNKGAWMIFVFLEWAFRNDVKIEKDSF